MKQHRGIRRCSLLATAVVATASLMTANFLAAFCGVRPSPEKSQSAMAAMPGKYRALTKIRLRKAPDTSAEPTGGVLTAGEIFDTAETIEPDIVGGTSFLRVGDGWIFDKGVAGRWIGKNIVEVIQTYPSADATPAVENGAVTSADSIDAASAVKKDTVKEVANAPASHPVEVAQAEVEVLEPEALEPAVAVAMAGVETVRMGENMLGAGFEFVRLEVDGASQPLTFMLGTGFPATALTSRGKELVGKTDAQYSGGWLSKAREENSKVTLKNVRFLGTGSSIGELADVRVIDIPQVQLAEQLGVDVHGILGKPFFSQYDLDLDRYRGRLELYSPGEAAKGGFYRTMKHLPGIALPSGNFGLAVKGSAVGDREPVEQPLSFVGMLDTSAPHSILNWKAAQAIGFTGPSDPRLVAATKVLGAGADGQPVEMPVALVRLRLCGAPEGVRWTINEVSKADWDSKGGNGWYFEDLKDGPGYLDFGAVNVAIGDALGLSVLNDSKIGPFAGAGAIIGQDVLFQADRMVLNLKDSQLWLQTGEVKDQEEM